MAKTHAHGLGSFRLVAMYVTLIAISHFLVGCDDDDDDAVYIFPPKASIVVAVGAVSEPGAGSFTVKLSRHVSKDVTISYVVGGTADAFDHDLASGTMMIPAGTMTATLSFSALDDNLEENDESIVVTLQKGSGYMIGSSNTATTTILSNDTPVATVLTSDDTSTEGADTGAFEINLSTVPLTDKTITVSIGGTAVGGDHDLVAGDIVITAGAVSKTVTLMPVDDALIEGTEFVDLTIQAGGGYTVGAPSTDTVSIVDNDVTGVTILASDPIATEGNSDTGLFAFTSGNVAEIDLTIFYSIAGTADLGIDYDSLSGAVILPKGDTQVTIPITAVIDGLEETDETVILTLSAGDNYTIGTPDSATVTITANDTPEATIAAIDAVADESGNTGSYRITLSTTPATAKTINYIVGGNAGPGDHNVVSGSLLIGAGKTSGTITLTATDDAVVEAPEFATVTLAVGTGYSVGAEDSANITIYDNESASLWSCGHNVYGQLGDGTTTDRTPPVEILASGVASVSGGAWHSLIVKTDGSLWAFGYNAYGQLGDGTANNRSTPVQILASGVSSISTGGWHSLILKTDGSLWAFGYNAYGQLGDGTTTNRSAPVQILASGVASVSAGYLHSLIVKTDGSLWVCGFNAQGQLGDGSTTTRTTPVQILASGVASVSAGDRHSLIVKTDGSLWAFGYNAYGQLGDGSTTTRTTPVQILASSVSSVSAGAWHTLIVKTDGALWACGENNVGRLGDGTNTNRSAPVQILASGVASVSGGVNHSLIMKTDGSLWACGHNGYGQLGDGTQTHRLTPSEIYSSGVMSMSAGGMHSLILK